MARFVKTEPVEEVNLVLMTINEFLSKYSRKRSIDNVFIKWFLKKDSSNPKKTVDEWMNLLDTFLRETV